MKVLKATRDGSISHRYHRWFAILIITIFNTIGLVRM